MFLSKHPLYKQVFSNSFFLGINYALNFLIPIIITPYVVQIIGLERFGIISIAQYLTQYFNVFVDYGFNLIATREISISENDHDKISRITSTAIVVKMLLLFVSFIVFLALVVIIPAFREYSWVYLLSFSIIIGQALSVNWFFQGVQKFKVMAVFNVLFKTLSVVLIFIFVKEKDDYLLVNLFLGIGIALASLSLLAYIYLNLKIEFHFPSKHEILSTLYKGWDIFISNFYISLYNYSNGMILSLFAPTEIVGIYSIVEKVSNVLRQIIGVFLQAIYPTTCKMALKSFAELLGFLKSVWSVLLFFILGISGTVYIFATEIIIFIIGKPNVETVHYLQIFVFVPIIVSVSTFFLTIVLSYNRTKLYSRIFLIASIINITLNFILSKYFSIYGTISTVFITEIFVLLAMIWAAFRIKNNYTSTLLEK